MIPSINSIINSMMNTYKSMHHQIPAFNLQKIPFPITWVQATVHISSCVCSEKMVARTFLEAVDKVKAAEGSAPKMTQPIETTKKKTFNTFHFDYHTWFYLQNMVIHFLQLLIFNWRIYVMKALQRRLLILPWGRGRFFSCFPPPSIIKPTAPSVWHWLHMGTTATCLTRHHQKQTWRSY